MLSLVGSCTIDGVGRTMLVGGAGVSPLGIVNIMSKIGVFDI
jgi:hypothetical protein